MDIEPEAQVQENVQPTATSEQTVVDPNLQQQQVQNSEQNFIQKEEIQQKAENDIQNIQQNQQEQLAQPAQQPEQKIADQEVLDSSKPAPQSEDKAIISENAENGQQEAKLNIDTQAVAAAAAAESASVKTDVAASVHNSQKPVVPETAQSVQQQIAQTQSQEPAVASVPTKVPKNSTRVPQSSKASQQRLEESQQKNGAQQPTPKKKNQQGQQHQSGQSNQQQHHQQQMLQQNQNAAHHAQQHHHHHHSRPLTAAEFQQGDRWSLIDINEMYTIKQESLKKSFDIIVSKLKRERGYSVTAAQSMTAPVAQPIVVPGQTTAITPAQQTSPAIAQNLQGTAAVPIVVGVATAAAGVLNRKRSNPYTREQIEGVLSENADFRGRFMKVREWFSTASGSKKQMSRKNENIRDRIHQVTEQIRNQSLETMKDMDIAKYYLWEHMNRRNQIPQTRSRSQLLMNNPTGLLPTPQTQQVPQPSALIGATDTQTGVVRTQGNVSY